MTVPTLTIGSGPITGPQQNTSFQLQTVVSAISHQFSAMTTAGTYLIAVLAIRQSSGTSVVVSAPQGWIQLTTVLQGTTYLEIWGYPNNPGGIQGVTFGVTTVVGGNTGYMHLSEWANVARVSGNAIDTFGTASKADNSTFLTVATTGNVSNSGELAFAVWQQANGLFPSVNFTTPFGWTRLRDNGPSSSGAEHLDIEYLIGPPAGVPVSPTLVDDVANAVAVGAVLVFKAAPPTNDYSVDIAHESLHAKLQTLDVGLMFGGRYQLEDGSGLWLLEDGSGYWLLDKVAPSLGDPVTVINPTWSGRVSSVTQQDPAEKVVNYQTVALQAANSLAAPGGAAPGDLSDAPSGGYYLLEDGSGRWLLEDGSGYYELEGTSYAYRHLSVQRQQNIDGSVTVYGTLETWETGFAAGQTFLLTNQNLGLVAQGFTIQNVTASFQHQTLIYLVEFGDTYPTLNTAGGGVLANQGSQAQIQQGAALPAGVLGYAEVIADQGTFTGATDIVGLTVTVPVVSGRRIRIGCNIAGDSSTANDTISALILEGSTVLAQRQTVVPGLNSLGYGVFPTVVLKPSAGTHTYKVQMQRAAGAGNVTMRAGGDHPASLVVEDIGS